MPIGLLIFIKVSAYINIILVLIVLKEDFGFLAGAQACAWALDISFAISI